MDLFVTVQENTIINVVPEKRTEKDIELPSQDFFVNKVPKEIYLKAEEYVNNYRDYIINKEAVPLSQDYIYKTPLKLSLDLKFHFLKLPLKVFDEMSSQLIRSVLFCYLYKDLNEKI